MVPQLGASYLSFIGTNSLERGGGHLSGSVGRSWRVQEFCSAVVSLVHDFIRFVFLQVELLVFRGERSHWIEARGTVQISIDPLHKTHMQRLLEVRTADCL